MMSLDQLAVGGNVREMDHPAGAASLQDFLDTVKLCAE